MAVVEKPQPVTHFLAGAHHTPINSLESTVAGRDVISPVFNIRFDGPVQMNRPTFDLPQGPGLPLNELLNGPGAANPPPQRRGILRGISKLLPRRRAGLGISSAPPAITAPSVSGGAVDSPSPNPTTPTPTNAASKVNHGSEAPAQDVSLTPLEDLEPHSLGWKRLTTPEIYVCSMLGSGKGLPCWDPRPRKPQGEKGVVPGDVGTFSAEGGFKKMFNLWDDEDSIQRTFTSVYPGATYRSPPKNVTIDDGALPQNYTLAHGAAGRTIYRSDTDNNTPENSVRRFEFNYQSHPGAVLALPSSADKEELSNHSKLRRHLIDHADILYLHVNSVWGLDDDESLYIITGCIKSEDWGIAAFKDGMKAPNDVIKLESWSSAPSSANSTKPSTFWAWTDKGTSDARFNTSAKPGVKDQSIFLRGFKLDFSAQFRAFVASGNLSSGYYWGGNGQGNSSADDAGARGGRRSGRGAGGYGGSQPGQAGLGFGNMGSGSGPQDGHEPQEPFESEEEEPGVSIHSFPDSSRLNSCHPCDVINEYLLNATGAPVALSHDDDWISLLEGRSFWEDATSTPTATEGEALPTQIGIINGVAHLENTTSSEETVYKDSPALENLRDVVLRYEEEPSQCGATDPGHRLWAQGYKNDVFTSFAEGQTYPPVLEPALVALLKVKMFVNPILLAPGRSSSGHLDWNLLFPTNQVCFSTNSEYKPWLEGRNAPATFPRTTRLRIVTSAAGFPWEIDVIARDPRIGVTCGDLIETLGRNMETLVSQKYWDKQSFETKKTLLANYFLNRGVSPGVPGAGLGEGLKYVDFLGKDVWWAGLDVIDPLMDSEALDITRTLLNQPQLVCSPCQLVLNLEKTSARTTEELEDWERLQQRRSNSTGKSFDKEAATLATRAHPRIREIVGGPDEDGSGSSLKGKKATSNSSVTSRSVYSYASTPSLIFTPYTSSEYGSTASPEWLGTPVTVPTNPFIPSIRELGEGRSYEKMDPDSKAPRPGKTGAKNDGKKVRFALGDVLDISERKKDGKKVQFGFGDDMDISEQMRHAY